MWRSWATVVWLLAFIPLFGQEVADRGAVGIEEHAGQQLPLDLVLRGENGEAVRLGALIDRPTVLMLVFFHCPDICRPLLAGVADAVARLDLEPLRDYRLLTVSFNEAEGPELARETKETFVGSMRRPFPPAAWRFLTADKPAIERLTAAVGFRFKREGMGFTHPAAIYMVSPDGRLTRYLYGIRFLPFDIKMGLIEAARGRVGPALNRVLLFCYSYDPQGRTYAFDLLKVSGLVILFLLLLFLAGLLLHSRRRRRRESE